MKRACFVHKAHPNGDIGVILIVQAVNPTLPKEGTAGNGKGDGVCNAAFPPPVAASDDRGVAEHQLCRLLIGLEARKHQAGNLKLLDLFQRIAPFHFSLNRCLRRPVLLRDDLVGFQHIKCHGILAIQSDAQAYKQAGNSVTANVIEAIGRRIREVDAELKAGATA